MVIIKKKKSRKEEKKIDLSKVVDVFIIVVKRYKFFYVDYLKFIV